MFDNNLKQCIIFSIVRAEPEIFHKPDAVLRFLAWHDPPPNGNAQSGEIITAVNLVIETVHLFPEFVGPI